MCGPMKILKLTWVGLLELNLGLYDQEAYALPHNHGHHTNYVYNNKKFKKLNQPTVEHVSSQVLLQYSPYFNGKLPKY